MPVIGGKHFKILHCMKMELFFKKLLPQPVVPLMESKN